MKGLLPVRWRHARWAVVAAALPLVWACNSRRLVEPNPRPTRTFDNVFQETVNRDVDILFMVDNSQSMQPLQGKLATNFPAFMNVLKTLPGGLPNVHIGIVSSDLGAGRADGVSMCRQGGDQGAFQTAPRAPCMTSGLMPGQSFIQSVNGMANFTGDIADVFTCMARLGDTGCGFEHQLASVLKALEAPNMANGFLRPNAFLSIILITNEDDCSAPPDSDLFDPSSRLVMDPLGPLASYRCNEFGHLCNGMKPPRMAADLTAANCTSAEDGRLLRVSEAIARTKALKIDPTKILVAAITGPVTPYIVKMTPANGAGGIMEDQPGIVHSCMLNNGEYADPSIRIKEWVDAFGNNGVFLPICVDSFAPALARIAQEIGKVIGPKCVTGKLVDNDLATPGIQPDCQVADRAPNAGGTLIETPVPGCADNGNTPPCWALVDSPNCAGSKLLQVNRGGMMAPSDLNTRVECAICIAGINDDRCK
ncbi:MAG TPA: hypothetical protein VFH73_19930 [Polyangia bacterium]|jgi:hypothetical protein|nr:hypothetical protein [Polyangia bacterium]